MTFPVATLPEVLAYVLRLWGEEPTIGLPGVGVRSPGSSESSYSGRVSAVAPIGVKLVVRWVVMGVWGICPDLSVSNTERIEVSEGRCRWWALGAGEENPVLSGLVGRDDSNSRSTRSKTDSGGYAEWGELGEEDKTWPVVEEDQRWLWPDDGIERDNGDRTVEVDEIESCGV